MSTESMACCMKSGRRTAASSEPAPGVAARAPSTAAALGCSRVAASKTLSSGGSGRGPAATAWRAHPHGGSPPVTEARRLDSMSI